MNFECKKCGKCCKDENTIVNIVYSDILRFRNELKWSFQKILDSIGFYIVEGNEEKISEEVLKKMVVPPVATENGYAFLGIRKDEDGNCIFLRKKNKRIHLCTLYENRPNICRTFPFHFDGKVKPKEQRINISMDYTEKALEYCPGVGKPSPQVHPDDWLPVGKAAVKSIIEDASLIKKWNHAVKDKKLLPSAENYIRWILKLNKTLSKSK